MRATARKSPSLYVEDVSSLRMMPRSNGRAPAPSSGSRRHMAAVSGWRPLLAGAPHGLLFSDHMDGPDGEAMFRHACRLGFEGIVSKKITAPYLSGRRSCWRKIKNPGYERR